MRAIAEQDDRIDRYELIAELASGGMATVFLARLAGMGGFQRLVAIKRPHPHLAREHGFTQMFLDEARLAARIHHPNVVPILEVGESSGYYLVMEYVEGDSLASLLVHSIDASQPLPQRAVVRIALDMLNGLHAAHELLDDHGKPLEIVHRDVSPHNVLVGADGVSRITDFGVARASSRLSTTRTGEVKGKLAYMAPEQARGVDCDRRADVFAAGIVLWEAFAGARLFKGEGDAETLTRVLFDPIPTLRSANPDVPEAIEAVIMKSLSREIEARFPTCADFADALLQAGRDLNLLGDAREVANYIESSIGTRLAEQRENLRAWLAKEPSASSRSGVKPSRPELSDPPSEPGADTRVQTPSSSRSASGGGVEIATTGDDVAATSVPPPTPSVAPAPVIAMASEEPPPAPTPSEGAVVASQAVATPKRSYRTWLLVASLVILLGVNVRLLTRTPTSETISPSQASSAHSTSASAMPASTATDPPTQPTSGSAPAPASIASSPSSVSSAANVTAHPNAGGSKPVTSRPSAAPARSVASPPTAATPVAAPASAASPVPSAKPVPALPSDMSYNPYR